ncbi:hypothetical protein B6U93_03220 [Candidatus Woesearchaeota archaeon ex4484_78]|nr:MAG: hypothetical protein B6U93_03220 [Candidatus Woesearchaeota archaeon ex4484_78]
MKKLVCFLIVILLVITIPQVFSTVNVIIADQGTTVRNKTSGKFLETGNLTVLFYTTQTGGTPFYNETFTNAIINGSWNVMLGETQNLSIDYGKRYYKDYQINGEDLDYTDNSGQTIERLAWDSSFGIIKTSYLSNFTPSPWTNDSTHVYPRPDFPLDVNVSGILHVKNDSFFGGNMTITGTLEGGSNFYVKDDIEAQGSIYSDENLKAVGNITGTYFFGNGSTLEGVCLSNGSNCLFSGDTVWNISGSVYLFNDSGVLDVNESRLNETIDSRVGNVSVGPWTNDSQKVYIKSGFPGNVSVEGDLLIGNIRLTNESLNGLWTGSLSVYSNRSLNNNLLFAVFGNGTIGAVMPHFWIQNGAPTQASGVSGSFMIANEVPVIQNSTSLTDCQAYMSQTTHKQPI